MSEETTKDLSPGYRKDMENLLKRQIESLKQRTARLAEIRGEMTDHDIHAWEENIERDKNEINFTRHILGVEEDSDSIEDAVEEES